MSDITKNKWISVVLSIIVIGIFFGGYTFYSMNTQTNQELENIAVLPNTDELATTTSEDAVIEPKLPIKPTIMTTTNELQIIDISVGTGQEAKAGDTISVNYLGNLEDGTKFDSSYDRGQAFTFTLGVGQVIQGWDQGVQGMKVGGKRKLIIPAKMAYGERGAGDVIPPGATLVFEVELVAVK